MCVLVGASVAVTVPLTVRALGGPEAGAGGRAVRGAVPGRGVGRRVRGRAVHRCHRGRGGAAGGRRAPAGPGRGGACGRRGRAARVGLLPVVRAGADGADRARRPGDRAAAGAAAVPRCWARRRCVAGVRRSPASGGSTATTSSSSATTRASPATARTRTGCGRTSPASSRPPARRPRSSILRRRGQRGVRAASRGGRWLPAAVGGRGGGLLADLSGLSKAEVERIWLPFAVWIVAGAPALPPATGAAGSPSQAATALAVNHLLLTAW